MSRRAVSLATAALVLTGLASGCAAITRQAAPTCSSRRLDPLILLTQSVPTASRVPCIANYPAGWALASTDVHSGKGSFTLNSDRAGHGALRVTLTRDCDTSGATEVPTDEPGARRFERILSVDSGFRAVRSYRFDGGCVTYRLTFAHRGQALINEASLAISFVTRSDIDARLRRATDGGQHL